MNKEELLNKHGGKTIVPDEKDTIPVGRLNAGDILVSVPLVNDTHVNLACISVLSWAPIPAQWCLYYPTTGAVREHFDTYADAVDWLMEHCPGGRVHTFSCYRIAMQFVLDFCDMVESRFDEV